MVDVPGRPLELLCFSLSVGRLHLKLYAGFILNIPIMGRPSQFVPRCHWCLSTDVVLVTPEMGKLLVWNTWCSTKKKKKVYTDVVQIPFLANLPLCQHITFTSGRNSGAADVRERRASAFFNKWRHVWYSHRSKMKKKSPIHCRVDMFK